MGEILHRPGPGRDFRQRSRFPVRMPITPWLGVLCLTAVAVTSAFAPPAHAERVTVVDGARVHQVEDPFVPPRDETTLGAAPGRPQIRAVPSSRGSSAVTRALKRAFTRKAITRENYTAYRSTYARTRSTARRLRGARKRELSYVLGSLERIALRRRLTASRMPALFLQLRRNRSYWPSKPFPADGDQVTFRGSEILFEYFSGRGLQIHPLSNFKKANNLHGACSKGGRPGKPVCGATPPGPRAGTPCRPARLRRLLDELTGLAVQRGKSFIAWEYNFDFGGGSPPWMSGMAQATGIVALARAARLLQRPDYNTTAAAALGAFETGSPTGVRARGPMGGTHYLQYSFAPRLYIFNAFFQSLIGLYDYGRLNKDPRATALFQQAEPEARKEVPFSSVGDWSRYSFRGRESTQEYHELLREVLQGLGRRLGVTGIYCDYATRYRGYQTDPPKLVFRGPAEAAKKRLTRVRFSLSKLSLVEVRVLKGRKQVFTRLATFRQGGRSVGWRPKSAGAYKVRISARELRTGRSLRGRTSATVTVR